jgi:peptide/nickel transport system substrate-binding protein
LSRRAAALAAISAVVAGAAACSSSSGSSGSSTASTPSTLTIVTPDTGMVFALDAGFGGLEVADNLHATLLRKPYLQSSTGTMVQDENTFDPYLASGYTVSSDGLTYTFKLRDAISAVGNHLTSADVIWSYARKFNTATSVSPGVSAPAITDPAKQFKAIDAHTVSITIAKRGYGQELLALLSDLTSQIYDAVLLKQHATPADPYAVKWSSNNPNYGFGPYEVQNYQPGVQVSLIANPHFVLGPPKIKNILVKIIADAGTRANLVRTGAAQLAEQLQPADLVTLKTGPGTKIGEIANPNEYMEIPLLTNKAPFNNMLVREAFAYAVPYQQIIDNVYHGLAVRRGASFLRTDAPGYDGSGFTSFSYDPARAKKLLAQAGHPNGVSYTLSVSAAAPDAQEAAIQIQTFAKAAGFTVTIDQLPASAIAAGRTSKSFQSYIVDDYAVTLTPGYELGVYTAKNGGNNLAAWYNPAFYTALDAANAVPDPTTATAGKLFNAAERIFINEAPIIFVAQIQPNGAMTSTLDGFAWRSDDFIDYYNLYFAK